MNTEIELIKQLRKFIEPGSTAIIGLGNPDRADDGCGINIASKLKVRFPGRAFLETEKGVESLVFDCIENDNVHAVIFIDATDFGGTPGEFRLFNINDSERFIPSFSTHQVPITFLMGLLKQQRKQSFLLGIQPVSLKLFSPMSPVIVRVANRIASLFIDFFSSK